MFFPTCKLKKAVGVLKEMSADERTRMIAEDLEKARRDEVSRTQWRVNSAKKEGKEEGRGEGLLPPSRFFPKIPLVYHAPGSVLRPFLPPLPGPGFLFHIRAPWL